MKLFFSILVYAITMLSATYAQEKLQLADTISDETGQLRHFRLSSTEPVSKASDATAFLKSALGANENTDFQLVKTKTKRNNQKSELYQQLYKDVPVYDAYYYLHYTNNAFTHANGEYAEIERPANSPVINEAAAIDAAVKSASIIEGLNPVSTHVRLTLWRQNTQKSYRYVYEVKVLFADATKSKICMVDAGTGEVLMKVDDVCYVNIPSMGATVYSGNRNFTGDTFAGGVRLREVRNGVDIATLNNQNNVNINAVDFANATTTWTSAGANEGALDVHFGVEMFLDYFNTVPNPTRNSIDDNGHSITSLMNRWTVDNNNNPIPMDNAFFDPNDTRFSFGNGNVFFNSLTSLDVVAHELAHGFAFFEVGFNNTGEARSLNEGFSDIWGATIENWSGLPNKQTWLMGEEIMANGFSSLRSLRNPSNEGWLFPNFTEGNYPDTRLGNFWDANNADPHINATVLGHWYFLLSQGGIGTNDLANNFNVSGLGIQRAAQIAYNTELALTPSADFISVRTASIAYATQEWGANSCELKTVTDAWFAVGVGAGYSGTLGITVASPSTVCATGAQFTLNNLPAGATATWTATPANLFATSSGSGTSITLSAANGAQGSGTIIFTVTANCGNPVQLSRTFWVGNPSASNSTLIYPSGYRGVNPVTLCAGCSYNFLVDFVAGATSYTWVLPSGFSFINGRNSSTPGIKTASSNGTYVMYCSANGCGSSWTHSLTINISGGGGQQQRIAIYPNPASTDLTIESTQSDLTISDNSANETSLSTSNETFTAKLFDQFSSEILNGMSKNGKIVFDVTKIKKGIYYLHVIREQELIIRQIIIEK